MLLQLAAALVLGAVALTFFLQLEHDGKRHVTFGIVLGALLLESILNGSEYRVPAGIFRIPVGGVQIRQVDLLMVLALVARFLAGGSVRRLSTAGLAWIGFLAYYTSAAFTGVLYGNPVTEVAFQAKAIYYLGGLLVLAAGTPLGPIVRARTVRTWMGVLAAAAVFGILGGLANLAIRANLGVVELTELGRYNNDAITLLVVLGGAGLLVEATRARRPWWVAAAGVLMLCAPFGGSQRANFLSLASALGVIGLASIGTTWRRRVKATPIEAASIVGMVLMLLLGGAVYSGASSDVVRRVQTTFFSSEEDQTTSARENLFGQAVDRIQERPLFGFGLGVRDVLQRRYIADEQLVTSHNIVLDVGTRSGLVGVVLLGVAIVASLADALRVWCRHRNPQIAALALGMVVVMAGILGKGMVESTFEKYRLNVGLGLALGVIAACAASLRTGDDLTTPGEGLEAEPVAGDGRRGLAPTVPDPLDPW